MNTIPQRFIEILSHADAGGVTEVCVNPGGGYKQFVGYFESPAAAAKAIAQYDGKDSIYVTLNPAKRELLARVNNKIAQSKNRTSDGEVFCDSWFFLDIDPKRATGISSTDDELKAAIEVGTLLFRFLLDIGVSQEAILTGISGNGAYVLVRLPDYEITKERIELKKRLLNYFADQFSTDRVGVDRTVYNPARLVCALGTVKMKGENIAERPHRRSEIRTIGGQKFDPALSQRCEPFNLYALAGVLLPSPKPPLVAKPAGDGQRLDIEQWMATHGIEVGQSKDWTGRDINGQLYVLRVCPFNSAHTNKSAFIIQADNGALAFGCHHNSCAGKDWRELRAMCEPERSPQPEQSPDTSTPPPDEATKKSAVSGVYMNLNAFFNAKFEEPEPILYGLHRGEVGGLLAITNYGKSTKLLNVALSIAAGERLWPLASIVPQPRRVFYLDFESPASRSQADLQTMIRGVSNSREARQNFMIVVDAVIKDSPLSLSKADHFKYVVALAKHHRADLVVIDTAASAFELMDENSNAEVTRRVMNPLKQLAREVNCAVVFTHHIGKSNETQTGEGAYRGRGASAFGALSRTIFTLERDVKKGPEYVVLTCAKIKGQPFEPVLLKLNQATRWFETCDEKPEARPQPPTAQEIAEFVKTQPSTTADLCEHYKERASKRTVEQRIKEAERLGAIFKPNQKAPWRFRNGKNDDSLPLDVTIENATDAGFPQSANPIGDCGNAETPAEGGSFGEFASCSSCGAAGLPHTHCDRCGEFLR
jgi:AAA domain